MLADASEIKAHLDAIAARVREAHAAADVMAEGDSSAASELVAELDGMAGEIAALRSAVGSTGF